MKKIIFVLFVISALVIGCYKEDIPSTQYVKANQALEEIVLDSIVSARISGERDLILFRNSLSTDNYLLTIDGGVQREHKVFNKYKVAYLQFSLGLDAPISVGGVGYTHYKVLVMYKDSTYDKLVAYSKDTLDYFKFYPVGENVLRDAHSAKVVTWTKTSKIKSSINEFRGAGLISVPQWVIKYDSSIIVTDYRNPISKQGNLFQPPHKN
jgi:hypothetical protein